MGSVYLPPWLQGTMLCEWIHMLAGMVHQTATVLLQWYQIILISDATDLVAADQLLQLVPGGLSALSEPGRPAGTATAWLNATIT